MEAYTPISLEKYDVMWVRTLWFYTVQSLVSYNEEAKILTFVAKHRFLPFVKHYSIQLIDGILTEERGSADTVPLSHTSFMHSTESIYNLNGFFWINKKDTYTENSAIKYSKIIIKNTYFFLDKNFALLTLSKGKIALARQKKNILTYYGNY